MLTTSGIPASGGIAGSGPVAVPVLPPLVRPQQDKALFPSIVRSEWAKLRSVRSTYWTLLATLGIMVGIGALLCLAYVARFDRLSPGDRLTFNPAAFSLNGLYLAQLAIGVLGVLVVASEYATGMIRATFSAVPQRVSVMAAKSAVLTAATAVVGIASSFAAFFVGQAILSNKGIEAHLSSPGVLRTVVGAGLYLAVLSLLALAIGTLLRRTAGAISTVFGLIFVLPALAHALPSSWQDAIIKWLPSSAGMAVVNPTAAPHSLGPWAGFLVFCGYAAVAWALAAVALRRRDA